MQLCIPVIALWKSAFDFSKLKELLEPFRELFIKRVQKVELSIEMRNFVSTCYLFYVIKQQKLVALVLIRQFASKIYNPVWTVTSNHFHNWTRYKKSSIRIHSFIFSLKSQFTLPSCVHDCWAALTVYFQY